MPSGDSLLVECSHRAPRYSLRPHFDAAQRMARGAAGVYRDELVKQSASWSEFPKGIDPKATQAGYSAGYSATLSTSFTFSLMYGSHSTNENPPT